MVPSEVSMTTGVAIGRGYRAADEPQCCGLSVAVLHPAEAEAASDAEDSPETPGVISGNVDGIPPFLPVSLSSPARSFGSADVFSGRHPWPRDGAFAARCNAHGPQDQVRQFPIRRTAGGTNEVPLSRAGGRQGR